MNATSQELSRQAPKVGPWIVGYALSIGLAFAATGSGLVSDPRIGGLTAIPAAVCVVMIIYTSWRRHRLLGTLSSASRRFWRRMVWSSLLMLAGFAISALVWDHGGGRTTSSDLLGLLPYAGFVGIVWAVHQYVIDESDEYLRAQAVRQILIAGFVTMVVAAIWSGLAYSRLLSPGWIGLAILIWFGGLGAGRLYNELRP